MGAAMTHHLIRRILVLGAIAVALYWVSRRWPGNRPPGGLGGGPGGPSPA